MSRIAAFFLFLCLGILILSSPAMAQEKQHKSQAKNFQIGAELRQYHYTEPGYVDHTGLMYGFWGEWLWNSALGKGRTVGDFVFGSLNYDGALCDASNKCTPYKSSTKDYITKISTRLEYSLNSNTSLFSGLGLRYLYDKGVGIGFYQRTGTWFYLPLGGYINFETSIGTLVLDLQYDFIVYGNFRSNLSDVSSSFTDLSHSQSGYGLSAEGGLKLDDYSVSAFYQLWDLNESDTVVSNGLYFIEPKNNSTSFGLKLGYRF